MSIAGQQRATIEAPQERQWEPTQLLSKVDNDIDLATELVELFLEDAPEMSYDISMAARAGSAQRLASAAHAYKGSASAIGAAAVAKAAGALEAAGRAGSADVELEMVHFKELEGRLIAELVAATTDA